MTVTVQQFRAHYPEFSSTTTFPNSQVQYWLDVAYSMLNAPRWGRQLDIGVETFTAHHISIEAKQQQIAAAGGIPGTQVGILNSKSVDKVSAGYDVGTGTQPDAGHWNTTIYGTRMIRMIRMFGAGPILVGVPGYGPPGSGGAWTGPITTPGFTNFGN